VSEQLIIRVGSLPDEPLWWLIWDASGAVIASGMLQNSGELGALAERVGARRPVVLLLPASEVTLKELPLPTKPNRQLLQALPFMLEEEQAEDIEQLLVVPAKVRQQDEQYIQQLAVLRRQLLQQWLTCLSDAGFIATQALPDALLLPELAQPVAIQLGSQWLLKTAPWQIACVDDSWWPDYLQLAALPELLHYSPWPEQLVSQPHQAAPAELPLALLAQQLPQQSFNLLQGEFAPKRPPNKYWQQWKLTAGLAAACVGLYLLQLGVAGWQYAQQAAADRLAAQQLYKQQFPNERIVNLRKQVERKLAVGSDSGQGLLALLSGIEPALGGTAPVRLNNLKYEGRKAELRFLATADSFQRFEQLKADLQQRGYQVEQGALNQIDGKVQGTLTVRGKA